MFPLRLSLALKLILICGLIGMGVNVLFWSLMVSFRDAAPGIIPQKISSAYSQSDHTPLVPSLYEMSMRLKYAQGIMNALETTRSKKEFLRLIEDEGLGARFESAQISWATDESLTPIHELLVKGNRVWPYAGYRVGSEYIAREEEGGVRWAMYFPADWRTGFRYDKRFQFAIMLNLSIFLILLWMFVIWQTRPLQDLGRAAFEVSRGNFNVKLPVRKNSILEELATAFNRMTDHVIRLIKSKEDLITAVSHELRSPLTRIRLFMEVDGERSLPAVRRELDNIEKLITDILDSKALESPYMRLMKEKVGIPELLSDIKEALEKQSFRIEMECPEFLEPIEIDRSRTLRVLMNLVENALKYSEEKIYLSARETGNDIEIAVRDRGPGIPEEHLRHVFEPFFRLDKSRNRKTGGFGFGLHLCQKIIEAHGGSIRAANHSEGGLEVTILLPRQIRSQSPRQS